MNFFTSIRRSIRLIQSTHEHEINQYQEIVRRLDTLADDQTRVAQALKELSAQQRRVKPTKRIWLAALAILLFSVAIVCGATSGIVHISLVNGEANTLHEKAQADRSQAIEEVVETLAPFDQAITSRSNSQRSNQLSLEVDNTILTVINNAENLLRQASVIDMQADTIGTSTAFNLYVAEVILVIGSAIAGGIISWATTQFLINKR